VNHGQFLLLASIPQVHHTKGRPTSSAHRDCASPWAIKGRVAGHPVCLATNPHQQGKYPLFIGRRRWCKGAVYARLKLTEQGLDCSFPRSLTRTISARTANASSALESRPIRYATKARRRAQRGSRHFMSTPAALHGTNQYGFKIEREMSRTIAPSASRQTRPMISKKSFRHVLTLPAVNA